MWQRREKNARMLFRVLDWKIQWLFEPFIEMGKWKKAEFVLGGDDNLILKRLGLVEISEDIKR